MRLIWIRPDRLSEWVSEWVSDGTKARDAYASENDYRRLESQANMLNTRLNQTQNKRATPVEETKDEIIGEFR